MPNNLDLSLAIFKQALQNLTKVWIAFLIVSKSLILKMELVSWTPKTRFSDPTSSIYFSMFHLKCRAKQ